MRIIRKIWLLQINGFPFCQCSQFVQLCELWSIQFKSGEIRTNRVLINCRVSVHCTGASTNTRFSYLSLPPIPFGFLWWQWISDIHWNFFPVTAHFPHWAENSEIRLSAHSVLRLYVGSLISCSSKKVFIRKSSWFHFFLRCVSAHFSPLTHWIFTLNIAYWINRFFGLCYIS